MKDQDWKAKIEKSKSKFTKKGRPREKSRKTATKRLRSQNQSETELESGDLEQFRATFQSQKCQKLPCGWYTTYQQSHNWLQSPFALLHTLTSVSETETIIEKLSSKIHRRIISTKHDCAHSNCMCLSLRGTSRNQGVNRISRRQNIWSPYGLCVVCKNCLTRCCGHQTRALLKILGCRFTSTLVKPSKN